MQSNYESPKTQAELIASTTDHITRMQSVAGNHRTAPLNVMIALMMTALWERMARVVGTAAWYVNAIKEGGNFADRYIELTKRLRELAEQADYVDAAAAHDTLEPRYFIAYDDIPALSGVKPATLRRGTLVACDKTDPARWAVATRTFKGGDFVKLHLGFADLCERGEIPGDVANGLEQRRKFDRALRERDLPAWPPGESYTNHFVLISPVSKGAKIREAEPHEYIPSDGRALQCANDDRRAIATASETFLLGAWIEVRDGVARLDKHDTEARAKREARKIPGTYINIEFKKPEAPPPARMVAVDTACGKGSEIGVAMHNVAKGQLLAVDLNHVAPGVFKASSPSPAAPAPTLAMRKRPHGTEGMPVGLYKVTERQRPGERVSIRRGSHELPRHLNETPERYGVEGIVSGAGHVPVRTDLMPGDLAWFTGHELMPRAFTRRAPLRIPKGTHVAIDMTCVFPASHNDTAAAVCLQDIDAGSDVAIVQGFAVISGGLMDFREVRARRSMLVRGRIPKGAGVRVASDCAFAVVECERDNLLCEAFAAQSLFGLCSIEAGIADPEETVRVNHVVPKGTPFKRDVHGIMYPIDDHGMSTGDTYAGVANEQLVCWTNRAWTHHHENVAPPNNSTRHIYPQTPGKLEIPEHTVMKVNIAGALVPMGYGLAEGERYAGLSVYPMRFDKTRGASGRYWPAIPAGDGLHERTPWNTSGLWPVFSVDAFVHSESEPESDDYEDGYGDDD